MRQSGTLAKKTYGYRKIHLSMIVLSRATFYPHSSALHQLKILADIFAKFGPVAIIHPEPTSKDSVFCRDVYTKIGLVYILARFQKASRAAEVDFAAEQLPTEQLLRPPRWTTFEGGDVLKIDETHIVCGFGKRTSWTFVHWLRETMALNVTAVRLVDSRAFHLDLCLCVFGKTSALIVKDAFSRQSLRVLLGMFPDHFFVDIDDRYVCNGLQTYDTYVVSHAPYPVRDWLRRRGVATVLVDCSEFHKEYGGVHCLTNEA